MIGKGLQPPPPELAIDAWDWSDAELFWIIERGVRMTGMLAFGATHDDGELRDVVAFLRRISSVSGPEYQRLVEATRARGGAHFHSHSDSNGGTGE